MKKKAYVIGSAVSKSMSPLIFNYWFAKTDIEADYTFAEVDEKKFDKEISKLLNEEGVCGINVTIPFKETAFNNVTSVENYALKIGAINCLTKSGSNWIGKNTDWLGFLKPLTNFKKDTNTKITKAIVIGYGGASKAIIYALEKHGLSEIKVFNRTYKKMQKLKENKKIKKFELGELKNHINEECVIINTTPTNPLKNINFRVNENSIGYDIVYKPKKTEFLSCFNEKKRIYGINMLVYQAMLCFEDWFGKLPPIDQGLYNLLDKKLDL